MITYKPLNDNVLVRRFRPEEVTPSGLTVPLVAQDKKMRGLVEAVGDCREFDNGHSRPMKVSVGQEVVFRKFAGVELPKGTIDDSTDWIVLLESDILMVVGAEHCGE